MTTHLNDTQADSSMLALAGMPGFRAPASDVQSLPGPQAMPLVGNAHQISPTGMHTTLEAWADQYGPMFKFQLGGTPVVGISDHILIHDILKNRPDGFQRPVRLSHLMTHFTPGVIATEGDTWRRQRRLIMRALAPDHVKGYFPILNTVTARLHQRWSKSLHDGQPIDVLRDLKCFSIDVTTWLALGTDIDTLNNEDNPLQRDIAMWFNELGRVLAPYRRDARRVDAAAFKDAMTRLSGTLISMVNAAREASRSTPDAGGIHQSILSALVAARDEPGSEFTDDDVQGNLESLLAAGEDTTANSLAWLFYFLAQNLDIQTRVATEADKVIGQAEMVAEFGQLDGCEYTEAAISEALRLKPIVPIQALVANVPANLAGLEVLPGQLIFLVLRTTGLSEEHFERAHEFSPERWLDMLNERADGKARKVFPFGGGPRLCPGRYLAICKMKMVTSMLTRNFEIRMAKDAKDVAEHFALTMGPDHLPLEIHPRHNI